MFKFRWSVSGTALRLLLVPVFGALFFSCKKDPPVDPVDKSDDLSYLPYAPKAYTIPKPDIFPEVPIPQDNPMTEAGVQLGRRLFYDPILSADSTQSCSSCHLPQGSFTDNLAVSTGIDGFKGRRSAMSLQNVAYVTNGLFWDGRAMTLEDQALRPVEDPIEMHNTWANVVAKLKTHPVYPEYFRKAFGISSKKEITKELAAKAIAQFERILISSGTSKFDEYQRTKDPDILGDDALDGKLMFFDEGGSAGLPDAQCFHCHGGITNTGDNFFNNGIDTVATPDGYADIGRGEVTKNPSDHGKFRSPTLRNIALTAPYMHDGRFKTLEEVLDHYGSTGKDIVRQDYFITTIGFANPADPTGRHAGLTANQKKALLAFLNTLTDTAFINNPDIQNPF